MYQVANYELNEREYFQFAQRCVETADTEKHLHVDAYHSGGNIWILSVLRKNDGTYFTFGNSDETWGCNVWTSEQAGDEQSEEPDTILLNVPSNTSDVALIGREIFEAVESYDWTKRTVWSE